MTTEGNGEEIVQFPLREIYIKIHRGPNGYTTFSSSLEPHPGIPRAESHPLQLLMEQSLNETVEIPWPRLVLSPYTGFQTTVWKALVTVPPGETRSYGELAKMVGQPGGAQAVGQALKRNPFPVLIPCHRIIKSDGSLGGYGGKMDSPIKQKLLEWENTKIHHSE